MKQYHTPQAEIEMMGIQDILTTSGGGRGASQGDDWICDDFSPKE